MKKFFTLIAAAMVAVAANAQVWKANAAVVIDGANLVDNDYATITAKNNSVSPKPITENEGGPGVTRTYAGYTFNYYLGVRINNKTEEQGGLPSADMPTGGEFDGCVALLVTAKKNVDVVLYYKRGNTKAIYCSDQSSDYAAVEVFEDESTKLVDPADDSYTYYAGTFKFQENHTYVIYSYGGTIQLNGIDTKEGTYVAPTSEKYTIKADCNGTVELTDIKAEFLNNTSKGSTAGAGTWTFTAGKATADQNGCEIKFTPSKSGRLAITFQAKLANNKSINMFVDGDASVTIPCYRDKEYQTSIESGKTPGEVLPAGTTIYYYVYAGKTYNFYAGGTKYAISDFEFDPTAPDAVKSAKAATKSSAKVAAKIMKGGKVVIVSENGTVDAAGAQM